ncbi:MAG: biotin--[acetyl-CoA-carboxylase] ligase [Bacteroidia bacterium]|nr:biotin--[acetyl-CoA-carboxylase] ligase [Bacteroidia bacterium]
MALKGSLVVEFSGQKMDKNLTTLFTGRQKIRLLSVDSTSSYLAEMLRFQPMPEGSCVTALSQMDGRGQAGNRWSSDEGKNILVSFVFFPTFLPVNNIFLLSKTFALGVCDYVRGRTGPRSCIKWPNDIYWNDRKIAGILIENSIGNSGISHSILGIGLNVNQEQFPQHLPNPVSLSQILGKEFDLEKELALLCGSLEARYLQLKRGEDQRISEDYLKSLYRIGEWKRFSKDETEFTGKITGVASSGHLIIEMKNGEVSEFDIKEVRFVI